jgi:glycerol-3-phosphate cytidylyltransferase
MKKVGFTCSCFDLFHAGHIMMLKESKSICDYLIVGLQTDPTIDRPEKNKPIQSLEEREIQFSSGQMEDVSKKGVKRAEEATISANDKYVNEAREGYKVMRVRCSASRQTRPQSPPPAGSWPSPLAAVRRGRR